MHRRFPFVKQLDSMQCGAACVAMICRSYGRDYSLRFISQLCRPTAEGASMLGIKDCAEALHLRATAVRCSVQALRELPLPCVLHWDHNHFVVLYDVRHRRSGWVYRIADPAKGRICCGEEELAAHWCAGESAEGIAMSVTPDDGFGSVEDAGSRNARSFRFLLSYLSRFRGKIAVIALMLLAGSLMQLLMPFLMQLIVDEGIRRRSISIIWLILLGELMIVAGSTVANFVRSRLSLVISMHINVSLVSDFFAKLLRLPMPFFETKLMGDLLQRISDHGRVQTFLTGEVLGMVFTLLTFVIFSVVLFSYDALLFAVFIAGSVVYGVWIALFLERRKVLDYELFRQSSKNQSKTFRFITTMQEIKLQNCEERRTAEWEQSQAGVFDVQMKALKLQQRQEAGAVAINEAKNIVLTVLAASAVIRGEMTLGAMLAVQYIIGQLNSPVEQFMSFVYSVQDVRISLERINEVHCSAEEENGEDAVASFAPDVPRQIVFDDVCFKYDAHALNDTISHVSVTIPQGGVTAIVGASGSGKTTLVKLMLGYYTLGAGRIAVAGRDLCDYNMKWWRSRCGVVMQDGVIFSDTIARNIAAADGEIDLARLETAARVACILDYIEGLPLGWDTVIGPDGTGLSQGQKQRILIARAVYRSPEFIFLDEATNSLDALNERAIVENLADFYKGRTVVVVAHRLSTVRDADNIVVMEAGRVAEQGTHAQLTAMRGRYYELVRNQLELGA